MKSAITNGNFRQNLPFVMADLGTLDNNRVRADGVMGD
jgi:hypothetical protein